MIGLFDRDVFLKLCCCGLWDEALVALGVTQPYRLQSTSSVRANRRKISVMMGAADSAGALALAERLVAEVPVVSDDLIDGIEVTPGFLELQDVDGIDGGEHLLTAILIHSPDGRVLLSGDKRFITAMRGELPDRWAEVGHFIISFEGCILAIIRQIGFEVIRDRLLAAKNCDGGLRLSIREETDVASFVEAMVSFNPCRD